MGAEAVVLAKLKWLVNFPGVQFCLLMKQGFVSFCRITKMHAMTNEIKVSSR